MVDDGSLERYFRGLSPCGEILCGSMGQCVCEQVRRNRREMYEDNPAARFGDDSDK